MNILFARFATMLLMIAGIAGVAFNQGGARAMTQVDGEYSACVTDAPGHSESTLVREAPRATRRVIRWQSFLPGTFR